ncbi:MAG: hypothetical protein KKC58_00370 [Gammaproteobacteria bacterium]|nr:hypothetical protein [Gammaproteobacteria bacterium]
MQSECKPLTGRNVLLIGIGFYDYELAIADELQRQGATVFLYDELPSYLRRGALASLLRRFKVDVRGQVRIHHETILNEVSGHHIDHLLVIKGEHITPWFLDSLRAAHRKVQLISYHWDSLARYPSLVGLQSYFDKVYTFDAEDAKRFPDFKLRPLFFRPEIAQKLSNAVNEIYDLSFVGWLHHDRLRQVDDIHLWADKHGLRTLFYLYTGWFSSTRLSLQGRGKFVKSRSMDFIKYVNLLHNSRAIVDLPHPEQTGLTMRAIEAVGAGKKLITTSRTIVNYDFYRKENILIIDGGYPQIDDHFLDTPTVELPAETIARYSLHEWVRQLFTIDTSKEQDLKNYSCGNEFIISSKTVSY